MNETKNKSLYVLQYKLFTYMLQKLAFADSGSEYPFINIQDHFR